MATATDSITANIAPKIRGVRREDRSDTIRIVEYASFPRVAPERDMRVGFTRDLSRSGMCLGADSDERVGSLLRLCVRDLDGSSAEPRVGRVVWSSAERDGRYWLGIEILTKPLTRSFADRRPRGGRFGEAAEGVRA